LLLLRLLKLGPAYDRAQGGEEDNPVVVHRMVGGLSGGRSGCLITRTPQRADVMSQSSARRRALRELSDPDAPITPLGTCTVQDGNGSLYSLLPQPQASADGIEGGTEMVLGYDAETNTYLASPKQTAVETKDHWANGIL